MILETRRRFFVVAGLFAAGLLMALLLALAPGSAAASKGCGTYESDSIYPRARVLVIRDVKCHRARRVARHFDHTGDELGKWQCGYAHDAGRRLFSCGRGGSGSLQDRPHALKARGVGSPS